MRRVLVVAGLLVCAGAALTSASARTDATRTICHRTASKTNPYVKLRVSGKALKAHLKHPADIIPAPRSGCPKTILTPTSGGTAFQIALTGEAESPAGDPVATGTSTVRLRAGQGQACDQIAAKNLPPAVAAHIHSGAAGSSGPVVVPLATPDASGQSSGCVTVARTLVASILGNPDGFYVNVHTSDFPGGAIRGQLRGTSTASFGTIFAFDLKGSTEPDATGTAVVRLRKDAGMICYRLHVEKITLPAAAAHIHKGGAGVNGPVVFPFTAPGADANSSGCAAAPDPSLIDAIIADPAGYYVNVHTKEHPGGAIRGQLG
jgi:hypothetical protein